MWISTLEWDFWGDFVSFSESHAALMALVGVMGSIVVLKAPRPSAARAVEDLNILVKLGVFCGTAISNSPPNNLSMQICPDPLQVMWIFY